MQFIIRSVRFYTVYLAFVLLGLPYHTTIFLSNPIVFWYSYKQDFFYETEFNAVIAKYGYRENR